MAQTAGYRPYRLEAKTFASKGNPVVDMSTMTAGYRLRALIATLEDGAFTQGAVPAAYTGDLLVRIFSGITHGKHTDTDGVMLRFLEWLMLGRDFNLPADVPAVAGAYARSPRVVIPFADLNSIEPGDTMPRVELFKSEHPQLNMCDVASIFPALASIAGTMKFTAEVEPAPAGVVNAQQDIGRVDFEGHTLKQLATPRAYTHLFLYKPTGAGFTNAELATLALKVDGEYLFDQASLQDLTTTFNLHRAGGAGLQTLSATVPDGGEELPAQADPAAGGSVTTVPFVPLYTPEAGYKLSKALYARESITVETTGTLTTGFKLGWRAVLHQDDSAYAERAVRLGYNPSKWRPKTASKNELAKDARVTGLIARRYGE